MRILFIIDTIGAGGKERQLVEVAKYLHKRKDVTLEVITLSKISGLHYFSDLGITHHTIERKTKKDARVFRKIYNICKDFNPDIIHTWERMCSVYAMPIAKTLGIKFINGSIRNAPLKRKKLTSGWFKDKITFPFSDIIFANSMAGLESFNVPQRKRYYIHNGFDFNRIQNLEKSESVRKRFNIQTDKVVGMVGRFDVRKDHAAYIKAASHILKKRTDITFLTIGDGFNARGDEMRSTLETCKSLVKGKDMDRIKFLGKQDDVESIINIFNIGVLLTNTKVHGEGISNAIMEYMALGKPVIATDSGGTKEIVTDNKTGFVLPENDIDLISKKIEFLIDNEVQAEDFGRAGLDRLKGDFSIEKTTEKFVALYQSCLRNSN